MSTNALNLQEVGKQIVSLLDEPGRDWVRMHHVLQATFKGKEVCLRDGFFLVDRAFISDDGTIFLVVGLRTVKFDDVLKGKV